MDHARLMEALARFPVRELPNQKGEMTGESFITCPVRIAFAYLDKPKEKVSHDTNEKYGVWAASLIIPPNADIRVLFEAAGKCAASRFGPQWQQMGLNNPFRPQAALAAKGYKGFATEGFYLDCESKFPVKVFSTIADPATGQPLELDPASPAVYSGMWALAILSVYSYPKPGGRGPKKQGVKFGLRQLQKIGDDEEFKSTGGQPNDAFSAMPAPNTAPNATTGFGSAPMQGAAPAQNGSWGAQQQAPMQVPQNPAGGWPTTPSGDYIPHQNAPGVPPNAAPAPAQNAGWGAPQPQQQAPAQNGWGAPPPASNGGWG